MKLSEAGNIVADYGAVLEAGSKTGGSLYPISSLPHPIEKIKEALQYCYHYSNFSAEQKESLGTVFVLLGNFVDDESARSEGKLCKIILKGGSPDFTQLDIEIYKSTSEHTSSLFTEWNGQKSECALKPPEMPEINHKNQITHFRKNMNLNTKRHSDEPWNKHGKLLIGLITGFLLGALIL